MLPRIYLSGMNHQELKQIITECVQEILAESALYNDVRAYLNKVSDPKLKNVFANWIIPLLSKSADKVEEKVKYIEALRMTILEPSKAPAWMKAHLEKMGVDINDPKVVSSLSGLIPILSEFQKFIVTKK